MGTADSREFDRLKERNFRPYSQGHRNMYHIAIGDLRARGFGEGHGARILEAGFGIGWGLDQMVEGGVLGQYAGYEPNEDSFNYVKERYATHPKWGDMLLLNLTFEANLDPSFDAAFCIEVIEHVPSVDHLTFLRGLYHMAPVLYFSTPDAKRVPSEGVRTDKEWVELLSLAGFASIIYDTSNWTTFYRAGRE
jgi:2-polyprenyl-3-methyl-5-hydroxy-6-metoxy-1,4-benzoquinol methylase